MGRVVIVVGFSTSGKSTLRRELSKRFRGDWFDCVDTDVELAHLAGKHHVYDVYYDLRRGSDCQPVINFVERAERTLLKLVRTGRRPLLIITGPAVPIRNGWDQFLTRVKPKAIIYLMLSPVEVYKGLKDRRRHDSHEWVHQHGKRDGFGCWDDGIMTEYDPSTRKWVDLNKKSALRCVRANMKRNVAAYQAALKRIGGRVFRARSARPGSAKYERLIEAVAKYLGA